MTKTINIDLDDAQLADLERAFPEEIPETCAHYIALFATTEMIDLLSGRKRYMSLSHQYIEWLESINEGLIPDIEFTPRRLMNQFCFPPGTAAYIARILRDRQNVKLMSRTWSTLLKRFCDKKAEHDALEPKERGGVARLWSITLSRREFRQLQMLLDEWEAEQIEKNPAERDSINLPEISENRLDFVKIKYKMTEIEKVIELLDKHIKGV